MSSALRMAIAGTIEAKSGVMKTRFQKVIKNTDDDILKAVIQSTLALHNSAVRQCATASSGTPETRYNPKREVMVSLPNNPPNRDTGTFVRSIQFDIDEGEKKGVVGTNDERGPWFEFGTTKMEKRPWLTPAMIESTEKIRDFFKKLKIRID